MTFWQFLTTGVKSEDRRYRTYVYVTEILTTLVAAASGALGWFIGGGDIGVVVSVMTVALVVTVAASYLAFRRHDRDRHPR